MTTFTLLFLMIGCSKTADDSGNASVSSETNEETNTVDDGDDSEIDSDDDTDTDTDTEAEADDSMCLEDYSLCGDLQIPEDYTGTARSLAVVLYQSIPPAGPPDGIIVEIENPDLTPGGTFPVRILPALFNGEYYVWVNLYMEGGGEWAPVNGVDYIGSTGATIAFDGTPVSFDDISLSLASGW